MVIPLYIKFQKNLIPVTKIFVSFPAEFTFNAFFALVGEMEESSLGLTIINVFNLDGFLIFI